MRDSAELTSDLLRGKNVRLTAQDMEQAAAQYFQWSQDAEYMRLVDGDPPVPLSLKATKDVNERDWPEDDPNNIMFLIRANEDDRIIGFANLDYISWAHGDSYMGIGLGDRTCWGRGYGSEAMNILLRYAFTELNLHRLTLTVFEFNERAVRMYQRCGFKIEGIVREVLYR
ncbi:MAG: acetyltransferase, family, partial [Proteobacteria bacterium]|nr:acetyltransferase, family [Pseudomonadota bacterium]